jgi:hypothetical protein
MLAYELLLRLLRSKHIHAYFQVNPLSQQHTHGLVSSVAAGMVVCILI